MQNSDSIYLVVTATGRANDLSDLTRTLHGREVPRALALIAPDGSLLQQTVASFSSALQFRSVIALVPEPEEATARDQLAAWPGVEVLAVPTGHGTARALLLLLAEILPKSPHAEIAVVSAESYIANPRPFVDALERSRARLGLAPAVLLGAAATGPEDGRRWLVPGRRLGEEIFALSERRIPVSEDECTALFAQEAMWNTSAFVARGQFLLRVLTRALPLQADTLARARRAGRSSRCELVQALADSAPGPCALDLDELMIQESGTIAVARVKGSGWNDWRTPEQVFSSLSGSFERAWLLSRLGANSSPPMFALPRQDQPASDSRVAPHLSR